MCYFRKHIPPGQRDAGGELGTSQQSELAKELPRTEQHIPYFCFEQVSVSEASTVPGMLHRHLPSFSFRRMHFFFVLLCCCDVGGAAVTREGDVMMLPAKDAVMPQAGVFNPPVRYGKPVCSWSYTVN
eukprot:356475-Chlamydomonas_euryale.AAC.2